MVPDHSKFGQRRRRSAVFRGAREPGTEGCVGRGMFHHDPRRPHRLSLPLLAALATVALPACDEFDDGVPDDLESRDLEAPERQAPDLEPTDAPHHAAPETPETPEGHEAHETLVDGQGHLDKLVIQRIVRAHINEIKVCYERLLEHDPEATGRLEVRFTVDDGGDVTAATITDGTLDDTELRSCVTAAVQRWKFPKPEGGGKVIITYPFNFDPA